MRLRELIFQGVLDQAKPQRLRPDGSLALLELPPDVTVEAVHDLLLSCLYPKHLTPSQSETIRFSGDSKIAVVLETGRGIFRVIRRADAESVRLQRKKDGGYEDLASGAMAVESVLRERLHLPPVEIFYPLHLWRFDADTLPQLEEGAEYGDDPRIPAVVKSYREAIEVESLEDEIKALESRIEDGKSALGEGAKVADKLERAREKLREFSIDEMSEEELAFLQSKEERLKEFSEKLSRLQEQEDEESQKVEQSIPEPPTRQPLFLGGAGVAATALVVSFILHDSLRLIALLAIPGFALLGIELLKYFSNMGKVSLHKVRLESIRRRITQLREEEALFRGRIGHMLLHAGVEHEDELLERLPKVDKLREIIAKLEGHLESIQRDPDYRRARKELTTLEEQLQNLRSRRQELPAFVMNSFQLEEDLKGLGVDPVDVRRTPDVEEPERISYETPFEWLQDVARWTDQWSDDGLEDTARSTWSKICAHVLSDRFDDLNLDEDGQLHVASLTDEQRDLWQSTRTTEVQAVVVALALALQINHLRNRQGEGFSSVWIQAPGETLTPSHAEKFETVFKSAARQGNIVICRTT